MKAIVLQFDPGRRARPPEGRASESFKNQREAFFQIAAREIDYHFKDKNTGLNRHYAMVRARRVIEEGGCVGMALRHALGNGWLQ